MLDLLFPRELRRLEYVARALPLNFLLLAGVANLQTVNEFKPDETILYLAIIAVELYTVAFVYLPRIRNAGMPIWSLVLTFIPVLDSALGMLMLFRRPRFASMRPLREKPAKSPAADGAA